MFIADVYRLSGYIHDTLYCNDVDHDDVMMMMMMMMIIIIMMMMIMIIIMLMMMIQLSILYPIVEEQNNNKLLNNYHTMIRIKINIICNGKLKLSILCSINL